MKATVKAKGIKKVTFGSGLLTKNLGFILFLTGLGLLYINNSQRGERKQVKIDRMEKTVQKSRWEYLSLKKELMEKSSPSQLAKDLEGEVVFPEKGPRILKAPKS
jgi:hypothetical protein